MGRRTDHVSRGSVSTSPLGASVTRNGEGSVLFTYRPPNEVVPYGLSRVSRTIEVTVPTRPLSCEYVPLTY